MMAILANRMQNRGWLWQLVLVPSYLLRRLIPFAFIAGSILLLLNFSGVDTYIAGPLGRFCLNATGSFVEYTNYFTNKIFSPLANLQKYYLNVSDIKIENIRLNMQNVTMAKQLNELEEIKRENTDLKALLNVRSVRKPTVTGKIINISSSPMHNNCIIDLGAKHGVVENNIVKFDGGLFGMVKRVSEDYSEVVMLQDPSCRVPVITEQSKENGILARIGDKMMLIYLPEQHSIMAGENIYSSGQGQIFPKGIKIGEVLKVSDDEVYVSLPQISGHQQYVSIELDK